MKVYGIMMVRNEADIIGPNIRHHFALGLDRLIVIDNGSSDGTDRVLRQLAADYPLKWTSEDVPYQSASAYSRLAREAFGEGADWIVPIDADEFWYATRGNFRRVLSETTAAALRVQLVNFIQRRDQLEPSPNALATMTRRIARPIGPLDHTRKLVESEQVAFVEVAYQPKWISRASATLEFTAGNHAVHGVDGPREDTGDLVILHAPLRARSRLKAKAEHGRRIEEAGYKPGDSWHLRRVARLEREGAIDREWAANSYLGDTIDVYGTPHKVIFDPRLRDTVAPWIQITTAEPADQGDAKTDEEAGSAAEFAHLLQIEVLETLLRDETTRRRAEVTERDQIIRDLQAELHAKVGERGRVIRDFQEELSSIRGAEIWRAMRYWAMRYYGALRARVSRGGRR